ncbi:MAG: MarR family winged helix-turn-helix transcriptional regulator [Streptosporangiaceae bacterium]
MPKVPNRQHTVKSPGAKHSAAGEILTALIIPVIQLEAHFSRAGEAIAASGGQTMARWLTLEMVAGQPATVAQVARNLGLTRQSVQRIADLLARDGLTEYVDNPAHQTSMLVRLTPRGRQTLRTIQASQRAWANRVGGTIGAENLRQASRVIDQLTRLLTRS